jgi:hypothetical protein
MSLFSRYIERLRFRYAPSVADWLIHLSTWKARRALQRNATLGILVDNTVLGHATTHETAWISTGPSQWGDQMIETGYMARVAVHDPTSSEKDYRQITSLPGLISLHRHGVVKLYSSAELFDEQFRQPTGRFRGYGMFDHNLFRGINLESIDGRVFPTLGSRRMNLPTAEEQQRRRLDAHAAADPDYASLIEVLGQNNSQDAWHIRTAERHGLHCFLTMDYRLIKTINAQKGNKRIKSLKTKIMTPTELAHELEIFSIPPIILSYTGASFPVRGDLSWPDGKRRGGGKRKGEMND